MTTKLVALDIDGTIVHHDGVTLSPRVRDAIRAVRDTGNKVVIATGRSVIGTVPVARALGLTGGFAVCSNGAVTVELDDREPHGYRLLDSITFDPRPVLDLLRGAWHDGVAAVEVVGEGFKVSGAFDEDDLVGEVTHVSWDELSDEPTTRVTFRSPTATAEEFAKLAEGIGLRGVNYAVGFTAWLDINPEGVSKASGLEGIRAHFDIPHADTVAVGDHYNDLEMLAWAGRGVAMGQAPDEVRAAADEVTLPVEQDGLALVLESLIQRVTQ